MAAGTEEYQGNEKTMTPIRGEKTTKRNSGHLQYLMIANKWIKRGSEKKKKKKKKKKNK